MNSEQKSSSIFFQKILYPPTRLQYHSPEGHNLHEETIGTRNKAITFVQKDIINMSIINCKLKMSERTGSVPERYGR
jgi:hypothetical protein